MIKGIDIMISDKACFEKLCLQFMMVHHVLSACLPIFSLYVFICLIFSFCLLFVDDLAWN